MTTLLKPEVIVSAALGLLSRSVTLPGLVWRNGVGNFTGAKNDTISIRVPAFAPARSRTLRSAASRARDDLFERKVDVVLDTDVYKDVKISDELLTLDITNFGEQILNPIMAGIIRKIEDLLVDTMQGATYANEISYTYGGDPYSAIAVEARRLLNLANVPTAGRRLVVGSTVEAELLNSDRFVKASDSGSTATLREGLIGRVAGFDVYPSVGIDPDEAYAFHQTAYALVNRAPNVPAGAPYGATSSFDGFAMRVVRVLDSATIEDILAVDAWIGANIVEDSGSLANGVFTPAEDPDDSGAEDLFVRAVKITAAS